MCGLLGGVQSTHLVLRCVGGTHERMGGWSEAKANISLCVWLAMLQLIIAELGGQRPPSGAPYPYKGTKGNSWIDFLMCIMASGIARGRVRTTTTVESRNMAAMLQLMG